MSVAWGAVGTAAGAGAWGAVIGAALLAASAPGAGVGLIGLGHGWFFQ